MLYKLQMTTMAINSLITITIVCIVNGYKLRSGKPGGIKRDKGTTNLYCLFFLSSTFLYDISLFF